MDPRYQPPGIITHEVSEIDKLVNDKLKTSLDTEPGA